VNFATERYQKALPIFCIGRGNLEVNFSQAMVVIVAKNRNGATGYTELIFEKPKFRFKSLAKILET